MRHDRGRDRDRIGRGRITRQGVDHLAGRRQVGLGGAAQQPQVSRPGGGIVRELIAPAQRPQAADHPAVGVQVRHLELVGQAAQVEREFVERRQRQRQQQAFAFGQVARLERLAIDQRRGRAERQQVQGQVARQPGTGLEIDAGLACAQEHHAGSTQIAARPLCPGRQHRDAAAERGLVDQVAPALPQRPGRPAFGGQRGLARHQVEPIGRHVEAQRLALAAGGNGGAEHGGGIAGQHAGVSQAIGHMRG